MQDLYDLLKQCLADKHNFDYNYSNAANAHNLKTNLAVSKMQGNNNLCPQLKRKYNSKDSGRNIITLEYYGHVKFADFIYYCNDTW